MNIAAIFIRRPVMTTLLTLAILIFGSFAYRSLPVSDLPNVDFPTIQVTASLPGASPETMASSVATPLERQFTTIAGLDSMTSSSAVGASQITLQFNLSRSIDAAAQDVQTAISRAERMLPRDMPAPPTYNKVNPADQPIIYIALISDTLPVSQLDDYGQTMLAQRISTINGVAQVLVYGSQKYAVRIQLDPRELVSRNLGLNEVSDAIAMNNVNLPTGVLSGPKKAFTIESSGQLFDAAAYRPLIVAYRSGAPVRLQEIGRVIDSVENNKTAAWYLDAKRSWRAVILAVQRQPGTNTVEIADAVKKLIPSFMTTLPAAAELKVLYDRSVPIQQSVNDVKFTLVLTVFLVVMVIFLFLRTLAATIIPALAVPISIVGTFAAMRLLGFSLDNLSLMALTLCVGFVVDDAVVMLENIVRHIEHGESVGEAAFNGSKEVGFTIISMTISLAAVFIPILFMSGIVGRLFNEFAVTITVAILISGFVSLSLTPMLCGLFLRPHSSERHGALFQWSERIFDTARDWYGSTLRTVFAHKLATMVVSGLLFALTLWMFVIAPKGFLPSQDMGQIIGFTESAQGISFDALVENQKKIASIVRENENVEALFSSAGARGGMTGSNAGIVFLKLKPRAERRLSADQIIPQLRAQLSGIPGMRVFLQNPPPIRLGGQLTKALYQLTLQSPDFDDLYKYAPLLQEKVTALPGFLDVTSDLEIKNPQVSIDIDRDRSSSLGLSAQQIENTLFSAYSSRQISDIYTANNAYKVILELLPEYQANPQALSLLYISSRDGKLVPLDSVASIKPTLGPLSVNHLGQLPSVTISFNLKQGVALSDAVTLVEREARQILPPTIATSFQGTAQAFQSSVASMGLLLVMAILVIYIVLGILYESFIHPLTILTALPFAGLGAVIALRLCNNTELSLYAFVGIIMLMGIVKKNGIMMVDFALEAQRTQHMQAEQAMFEACLVRFRPIMMTSMAALLGALPLALAHGAGSEARQPLGIAVVGGLIFSQLLTLYVTPVFFIYMDRLSGWLKGKMGRLGEGTV